MSSSLFAVPLELIRVPVDDKTFYVRTFLWATKRRKQKARDQNPFQKICYDELERFSRGMERSGLQDAPTARALQKIRKLVDLLIDDKGELNKRALEMAIEAQEQALYSLGPERQYDAKHQEQILRAMKEMQTSKEMQIALKKVSAPYLNRFADQLIRDALLLPRNSRINDPQARRAALAAWFTLLRQNVGSCFATAPAILVHDQQPALMFKDFIELLGTGRLKRTYEGSEHSVPLSLSWGVGDLYKPVLTPVGHLADTSELWTSPGIYAALEAAGLLPKNLPMKNRLELVKGLILPHLIQEQGGLPYRWITTERLLEKILMSSLQLTEDDLKPENVSLAAAFTGSIVMQTAAASGGKSQVRNQFFEKFNAACIAFKGLADNALLKSWEFTMASFTEMKANFTRWNLYSSLGFGADEEGGIGSAVYQLLEAKLEQVNREIENVKVDHEQALSLLQYLQTRMKAAGSEKENEWLKLEYRTRVYEYNIIEERFQELQRRAQQYSQLLNVLIQLYSELFPRYFQEVYDADMHEVSTGPYDDSPAGFRLFYKYGRSNTAQWSPIETPEAFIDALASFFTSAEAEISSHKHLEGLSADIADIVTAIVQRVRSPEFLETAFHRMARAHGTAPIKNPLEHLEKIDKKPWAYTSGGSMTTLVSTYWRREQPPTQAARWVENPTELLVFLIDTLKQMPPKITDEFAKDPKKSLLMSSPTHAFLLKPGNALFKSLWQNEQFTYTYLRDHFIRPAETFLSEISLDQEMAQFLIEKLSQKVPLDFRHYFRQVFDYIPIGVSPKEFRFHLVSVMSRERGLAFGKTLATEEIDGMLFSQLPLSHSQELKERVFQVIKRLPDIGPRALSKLEALWEELPISMLPGPIISAQTLQEIIKAFLCLILDNTTSAYDYHWHVSQVCKKLRYALPPPIIVADTNWTREEFGFLVNPGTGIFEFWRLDYCATVGYPIPVWDQWLDGTNKATWNVYTRPQEYQS